MTEPANVIIFGETGVGKSSVVNMILGRDAAKVSDSAKGCTFESAGYPVDINGKPFKLHDTVGLGEVKTGTVDTARAIKNLYRLVKRLSDSGSGGINLLILVIKAGRLTETIQKNYTLFHKGLCESQVPIVIVITGCENVEPTLDSWWPQNEKEFVQARLSFAGQACVCAFRGRRTRQGTRVNDELYEDSKEVIERLIPHHCSSSGFKKPPIDLLKRVVRFFGRLTRSTASAAAEYPNLRENLSPAFPDAEIDGIIDAINDA